MIRGNKSKRGNRDNKGNRRIGEGGVRGTEEQGEQGE